MMSQVLQWTQFEKLIFGLRPPLASSISYTAAGQKYWQGFPYSTVQRLIQILKSRTFRWGGWSSLCSVPERETSETLSKQSLLSHFGVSACGTSPGYLGIRL